MSLHPPRTEHAQIWISMPGTTYHHVKQTVEDSGATGLGVVYKDDTVNIEYDFTIEYIGVVRELQALLTLLNHPDITDITSATLGERNNTRILCADLINALRDVQERLAAKEDTAA